MAIARVQQIDTMNEASSGGGEDVSFVVPAGGVALGHHVMIGVVSDSATATIDSIFDSKGNTYAVDRTQANVGNVMSSYIVSGYIGTALAAADTITLSFTSFVHIGGVAVEFSGLVSSNFLDRTTGANTPFDTNHSSGLTSATTQADELLWGCSALIPETVTWAPAGSWIEELDLDATTAARHAVVQYQIVSATSTYESNGTSSAGADSANAIATYKADISVDFSPTYRPRIGWPGMMRG